jgi:hypothetical protein
MKSQAPKVGLTQAQSARVNHLQALVWNLPTRLPAYPLQSNCDFTIDCNLKGDIGLLGALNTALERLFQTYKHAVDVPKWRKIECTECRKRVEAMMKTICSVLGEVSPSDRNMFMETWLEPMTQSAKAAGAVIPKKTVASVAKQQHSPANPHAKSAISIETDPKDKDMPVIIAAKKPKLPSNSSTTHSIVPLASSSQLGLNQKAPSEHHISSDQIWIHLNQRPRKPLKKWD